MKWMPCQTVTTTLIPQTLKGKYTRSGVVVTNGATVLIVREQREGVLTCVIDNRLRCSRPTVGICVLCHTIVPVFEIFWSPRLM